MGKVGATAIAAAATEMKRKKKKKKGRPSLLDLQKRSLLLQQQQLITSSNFNRRSTRRNPNSSPSPELIDDDDERKEKKVKLVVRLPQSNQHLHQQPPPPPSSSFNSLSSASDSNADGENHEEVSHKKRKSNAFGDRSDDILTDQGEKISKATDTPQGCPFESGPTTPLPDKKLLVFILDRLQKKDTYGVFSEPVDPNELPDYHQIIEHPMDFGTVRKKLDKGLYPNLEELEADVLLIGSNAMQYNSPDTVYFRQARSIQELAKRDFENLRQEGDDGELQPKVVRRGRPPGKNLKKSLGSSSVDRVGPELSSGATLATGEDNMAGSNTYNLRRGGPTLYRFQSTDASATSHRSRNGENHSEWLCDWNNEFPASILKADMKYGNKHFSLDETRRDTYKQFHPSVCRPEPPLFSKIGGDMKQLMPVGLHVEHGYARSLARFAANLGPVVWKVASKKFGGVLPSGVKLDHPGLAGENGGASQQPKLLPFGNQKSLHRMACDANPSGPLDPSTSGINSFVAHNSLQDRENLAEADRKVNPQNELVLPKGGVSGSYFQNQHNKNLFQLNRNGGVNGAFGYNMARLTTVVGQSSFDEGSASAEVTDMVPRSAGIILTHSIPVNHIDSEEPKFPQSSNALLHSAKLISASDSGMVAKVGHFGKPSLQVLSPDERHYSSIPVPPDLNVRIQASSSPSSSSLRIGSPQQPDLALQL
ncbi:hypothetical protein LguiB_020287 [Lonicera macranthoides]